MYFLRERPGEIFRKVAAKKIRIGSCRDVEKNALCIFQGRRRRSFSMLSEHVAAHWQRASRR
jgi:hypothetical protein